MKKILFVLFAFAALLPGNVLAEAQFKLRASVDTSATHARTQAAADYLRKLQERSGGRIETELFHSGQLFRDRDVVKGLRQGAIEMAIPGTWVLTGFVPDADVFLLPSFFGQKYPIVYAESDGKVGEMISAQFESKLSVKLLGPWLPLGYQNIYSTNKPLRSMDDLAGMKIRTPGGAGLEVRARFFQAKPTTTAWPDVPLALSQGMFDAVSSTDESIVSAKLWESGVKYAIVDRDYIGFYVPMISESFYSKLPPDLQALVVDVWRENIPAYRKRMEESQEEARRTMAKNGITVATPSDEDLAALRAKMAPTLDSVAKDLRISPAVLQQVKADIAVAAH